MINLLLFFIFYYTVANGDSMDWHNNVTGDNGHQPPDGKGIINASV